MSKDEHSLWNELKGLANKAQVRLVTSTELRAHQKTMREEKREKIKPAGKKQKKEIDPRQASIHLAHFHASSGKLQAIELGAFGPDAAGIVIVKPEEAKVFLPVSKMSADALAMLVITREVFDSKTPDMVPAIDHKQTPVLIPCVLLNFWG